MRILGFSKKWDKLHLAMFTTFRFPRKDKDWQISEEARVIYKPRQKGGGEFLGIAKIIRKEPKAIRDITEAEAAADGFYNHFEMWKFLKCPGMEKVINKLTLIWLEGK